MGWWPLTTSTMPRTLARSVSEGGFVPAYASGQCSRPTTSPPHYLFTFLGFVSLFAGCHAHVCVGMLFNHAHADVGMAPGGEGKEFNRSNHEKCESDDRNDCSVCHAAGCNLRWGAGLAAVARAEPRCQGDRVQGAEGLAQGADTEMEGHGGRRRCLARTGRRQVRA